MEAKLEHSADNTPEPHALLQLEDCPYCGGPALLEEENGWCWYVMCADCGAQTASFGYKDAAERREAAQKAAHLWNLRKVIRANPGE